MRPGCPTELKEDFYTRGSGTWL